MMYQTILVDDEVLIREAIKENMDWKGLGCELVGCFQSGKEAIEYIRQNPVDIIITDICMPFMDGLALSKIICEEYETISILILSGYDNFEYAKQAMKYQVDDYLLKPVSAQELGETITRLIKKLEKKRAENQSMFQIKHTYNKNKIILKSKTIMNLIIGSQTLDELYHELEQYNVCLNYTHFCVAVLKLWIDSDDIQDGALISFIVHNIADEIIKGVQVGEVLQKMDNRVVVLFTTNSPRSLSKNIKALFQEIQQEVRKVIDLDLTVGVGGVVTDVRELHLSYEVAEEVLDYEYIHGQGSIFIWEEINQATPFGDWRKQLQPLQESLKNGHKRKIHQILQEMQSKIQEVYLKKEKVFFVFQEVFNRTKLCLEAFGLAESQVMLELHQVEEHIGDAKSLEAAVENLTEICVRASDAIEIQKDMKGQTRASLALDYIKNHYMDPNMNLQSVCDYLNMSSSRFSAMFKECTGGTFMDALISIRMEKAKELIRNTSLKNYEVADRVGFTDPHYFSISFKKATGKTPKEYAKEKRS